MKERASPRRDVYFVPRKHSAEPRGEGTLHYSFREGALSKGLFTRTILQTRASLQNAKMRRGSE